MVPSFNLISVPAITKSRAGIAKQFVTNADIAGQKKEILWRIIFLLMKFEAFAASTSKPASVDYFLKIFPIQYIALSDPASSPAQLCSDTAKETTSLLTIDTLTFHVILQRTFLTPIGRKPGIFLKQDELACN